MPGPNVSIIQRFHCIHRLTLLSSCEGIICTFQSMYIYDQMTGCMQDLRHWKPVVIDVVLI